MEELYLVYSSAAAVGPIEYWNPRFPEVWEYSWARRSAGSTNPAGGPIEYWIPRFLEAWEYSLASSWRGLLAQLGPYRIMESSIPGGLGVFLDQKVKGVNLCLTVATKYLSLESGVFNEHDANPGVASSARCVRVLFR